MVNKKTENFNLPIFQDQDYGNWFDFNQGFQEIDEQIKTNQDHIDNHFEIIQSIQRTQTDHTSAIIQTRNRVNAIENQLNQNVTSTQIDIVLEQPSKLSVSSNILKINEYPLKNAKINTIFGRAEFTVLEQATGLTLTTITFPQLNEIFGNTRTLFNVGVSNISGIEQIPITKAFSGSVGILSSVTHPVYYLYLDVHNAGKLIIPPEAIIRIDMQACILSSV